MMMSEGEICYRYRINGCYGEKHISILAQLSMPVPVRKLMRFFGRTD